MKNVAVIDCGSNSFRMLIAQLDINKFNINIKKAKAFIQKNKDNKEHHALWIDKNLYTPHKILEVSALIV